MTLKFSSIILTTFISPLTSPVHTLLTDNIPFLVVSVSFTNDISVSADLYTKLTDKRQPSQHSLLYSSCHPLLTKKAIPFSLALFLRRTCSTSLKSLKPGSHLCDKHNTSEIRISISTRKKGHVSFSCAYAYFPYVMPIAQV